MIEQLLTLQNQLRLFHWQTFSYAQHVALGKAYEALDDLIDGFVEEYFGKYDRTVDENGYTVSLENLDKSNILSFVDENITFLTDELPKELEKNDTNLLNIRDDMLGELQRLKYLLSLE